MGIGILLGFSTPARAQSAPLVSDAEVTYIFGEQITFQAKVQAESPIQSVNLVFRAERNPGTFVGEATLTEEGQVYYAHDVRQQFVPAFARVDYWFVVELADGSVRQSDVFSFFYEDNRFDWQVLKQPPLRVHWYAGDVAFAQFILDAAQMGMARTRDLLPAPLPRKVEIYVYANTTDYQFAQGLLGPMWAGGHADPAAGLILVSLPPSPEQRLQIERKIPHEIAHIMLYQATGEHFDRLPSWLNEGIASQIELYPNPDYPYLLETAHQKGMLIPLSSLCASFPRETANALLSYAQATSFVHYLQEQYGPAGILALVKAYTDGAACERGTAAPPFNKPLSQLEKEWLAYLFSGQPSGQDGEGEVVWLALLGVAIISWPLVLVRGSQRRRKKSSEVVGEG